MDRMRMFMRSRRRRGNQSGNGSDDDIDDDDMEDYFLQRDFMDFMMRSGRRDRDIDRDRDRRRFGEEEISPTGSDGFRFQYVNPESWEPPQKVEAQVQAASEPINHGTVATDAILYSLKEKNADGSIASRTVLKMPSRLPIKNVPSGKSTFNILMADVSGSMSSYWNPVKDNWNRYVAPHLEGKTRIFTFDSKVRFRRDTTNLESGDFSSGGTELTGALQTIVSQVYTCTEELVNVFIITDGDHNGCKVSPSDIITQMDVPKSKICQVFLLGAGFNFPVQYSVDIRSYLHNGSSNLPTIYWTKSVDTVAEQMEEIGSKLKSSTSHITLTLSTSGYLLPGLNPKNIFHLEEFVYFPDEPEILNEFDMKVSNHTFTVKLEPKVLDYDILISIFRQWNTTIIQLKSKKEHIPVTVIPLMENLYETLTKRSKPSQGKSISERISGEDKGRDMEFRTFINKIKEILTKEKYENQIDLAEKILSTSVTRSKHEVKALQLKGHTDKEFEPDIKEFSRVYNAEKENILRLKMPPEYLCQITHQSTLTDLQDEDFPKLLDLDKFEFLKSFTISGIPVYAPTRDAVALNPWSYRIQKILKAPYVIMSQVAMETMAKDNADKVNKKVQVKKDDSSTDFNAIVPVFPSNIAKELQPIVRTRVYAMCVTFATIKNPHLIDFNVHMATLAVTWVRLLFENPTLPRPEYVKAQMESIEATASCYMDRPGFANYVKLLTTKPNLAMMTESTEKIEGKPVMCETMVKPMFLLNMMQLMETRLDSTRVAEILRLILLEYIGRCLTHYRSEGDEHQTPYTDFFATSLEDQEKKKQFIQEFVESSKSEMLSSSTDILIESFYTFEEARKAGRKVASAHLETMKEQMTAKITIDINQDKVKLLRNVTSAGDVSWQTLETFARHIGLDEEVVSQLFCKESMFVYTTYALKYRASRERLAQNIDDYETCRTFVTDEVKKENLHIISQDLLNSLSSVLEEEWLKEYNNIHTEIVEPMTPQQIVYQAQQLGVEVTEETFDQVYKKYRPSVGLLGNACQTKQCPYYLQPNKRYNQHASVERLKGKTPFIHGMHVVAKQFCSHDLPTTMKEISSGKHNKEKKDIDMKDVKRWESGIQKLTCIYSEREKNQSS